MAKARPVRLHADMPYGEAAARTVRVRAAELAARADGVLDTDDIERVHDMRVATRRLRAALEAFEPCFDRRAYKDVLSDVKELAAALGARRDPDVHLEELEALAERLGVEDGEGVPELLESLRAEQEQGNRVLAKALERARRHGLAERLRDLADEAAS